MSVPDEELKAAFAVFDADGSGHITKEEITKLCEELGVDASKKEINDLMESADADNDGKISYDEFKAALG